MKYKFICIYLLIIFTLSFSLSVTEVSECDGNSYLRENSLKKAEQLFTSTNYADSNYFYLKMGELSRKKNDFGTAKHFFRLASKKHSVYAPYAFRRIGDIELEHNNIDKAIISYRKAAEITDLEPYKFFLYNKIDSLATAYENKYGSIDWIIHWHKTTYGTDKEKVTKKKQTTAWSRKVTKRSLTPKLYDTYVAKAAKESSVVSLLKAISDTAKIKTPFSTKKAFAIAQRLEANGLRKSASDWMHWSLKQKDFSKTVSQKQYTYFRATLNFKLKNWSNAAKWGETYTTKYGDDPTIIYNTARAYRKAGQASKSAQWYSKHVSTYPKTATAHKIRWYQAWQEEDAHQFDKAIKSFKAIAERNPDKKFGDDAAFRVGLLHYRKEEYNNAIIAYKDFLDKFPKSNLYQGSLYWIGRSYQHLKKKDSAQVYFEKTINRDPINYYAWRAREKMPKDKYAFEKVVQTKMDSLWIQELKDRAKPLKDSLWEINKEELLDKAVRLGTLGFNDEAEFLIEPVVMRSEYDYPLLLELSTLLDDMGEHHRAYKISKKLYWKLPHKSRQNLPLDFLTKLYPDVYPHWTQASATNHSVNRLLIPAIMRQESMFSPTIKSWVGATGLMQIMPYTGKEIASDLDTTFKNSMLLEPELNIEFGTYYISKLLKKWDNDAIRAIASYNGGPHNVTKWVKRNSEIEDPAFFVEFIGFSETRHYVKKVLQNLWTYTALEEIAQKKKETPATVAN